MGPASQRARGVAGAAWRVGIGGGHGVGAGLLKLSVAQLKELLAETTGKLNKFDAQRKKLLSQIIDLKANARVFCRVRPLLPSEAALERSHVNPINSADNGTITLVGQSGKDVKGKLKT